MNTMYKTSVRSSNVAAVVFDHSEAIPNFRNPTVTTITALFSHKITSMNHDPVSPYSSGTDVDI